MRKNVIVFLLLAIILVVPVNQANAKQAKTNKVYHVKNGDTLVKISRDIGVPVRVIVNQNDITNPSNIHVGQKLVITIDISYDENDRDNNNKKSFIYYTVKSGDILWNIAQEYNTTVEKLVKLNNIQDANDMYVGRQLLVPIKNNQEDNDNYRYYTVKKGDILWNIAQRYNTTVAKLVELNNIQDAYDVYPGRQLILPTNTSEDNDNQESTNYSYPLYYFYKVQQGENLNEIANKFGVNPQLLVKLNKISNSNNLKIGNTVIIPLDKSKRFKFSYLKNTSQKLDNYYRVDKDELLPDIETLFNVDEDALRNINNLDTTEEVHTGQKLLMPINPALFNTHKLYTVKEGGEYIFDIAFNHSVTINSILKANYLKDSNTKLKTGTKIIIPLTENSKTKWIEYENGMPKDSLLS